MKTADQITQLKKKILQVALIRLLPSSAVAFGVIAKFSPNPEEIHPIFGNDLLANTLLIIGIPLMILCVLKLLKLQNQKKALESI